MRPEEQTIVDLSDYKEAFGRQKRIRIENVFTLAYAQMVFEELAEKTAFNTAFIKNNEVVTLPDHYFEQLSLEQRDAEQQEVFEHAKNGVGFHYKRRHLFEVMLIQPVLMAFYQWLNSSQLLHSIEQATGIKGLKSASAQATCYVPGSFLTAHHDVNLEEERKIAYVFNFSKNWLPDWGGLLQFFSTDITCAETWLPLFNSLVLFDVTLPHSVTYVTPFAENNRYSITGWFNGK